MQVNGSRTTKYKQRAGTSKKGEKASFVVFWKWQNKVETKVVTTTSTDGKTQIQDTYEEIVGQYPVLKSYNVFHIDQTEGIKPKWNNEPIEFEHTPVEMAEQVIEQYVTRDELKLRICNSDRAFYSPMGDYVQVPERSQYKENEEY